MEHIENILCWNIARWTLSVWATSQTSYCRVHHTDPHLQGTYNRDIQHLHTDYTSGKNPGTKILVLLDCSARCSLPCQACGRVLQLFRRTVGLCPEDEWAQNVPQYGLVILFVSFNRKHHIITALFIWEEHYKCWTEYFICFWFSGLLMFLQHYSALNHGDSLSCHTEKTFFSLAGRCPLTPCQQYRNCGINT